MLQIALIPNCTLKRSVGDFHVVLEQVSACRASHTSENSIRVHIVSLAGFEFENTETNVGSIYNHVSRFMTQQQVVPTCTCPANRNVKDCCAGIMCALQTHPKFKAWFGRTWHKKELLARRHRADCDPFVDIAQVLKHEVVEEKPTRAYEDSNSRIASKNLLLPDSVHNAFKEVLELAGDDQFLVCTCIVYTNILSYSDQLSQLQTHVEKGHQLMTSLIQDRQIAHKGRNGRHTSTIEYTKGKFGKGQGKGDEVEKGTVFKPHNMSPMTSTIVNPTIAKRAKQSHPGTSKHLNWRELTFCQYCNYGVKKLDQHQKTGACTTTQSKQTTRYVQCMDCSAAAQQCIGHAVGSACPRLSQSS